MINHRGPLALALDWEDALADGEIPSPTGSSRLVMLENHRELQGTHADEAIRGLRSALQARGWEIVDDPDVLAASIIDIPRDGIAGLNAMEIGVAKASLEELSEQHLVDTVLFVRTRGDEFGGSMEIEFWTDGVGRIAELSLYPESMIRIDRDQALNELGMEVEFIGSGNRILSILHETGLGEIEHQLKSSLIATAANIDPHGKGRITISPITIGPVTIDPVKVDPVRISPIEIGLGHGSGTRPPASVSASNN